MVFKIQLTLLLSSLSFISLVSSQTTSPPGGYYHTKYDHLDVEDVLNHKRLVHHYANCLLSRGPCPPEGADLKRILPEALETNCVRCTAKQRFVVLHTIKRLRKEYPNLWKEVQDLWDPTGEFIKKFEQAFDAAAATSSTTTPSPNEVDPSPNLLSNRFSEDDSSNDLIPSKPRPYPPTPVLSSAKPTVPSGTSSVTTSVSSTRPSSSKRPSTSTITASRYPTAAPPSAYSPFSWWVPTTNGLPPVSNWRPTTQNIFFRPQATRPIIPVLNIDGAKIFSDIGTKLLQAGTQAAGMVLSTVQALVGHN